MFYIVLFSALAVLLVVAGIVAMKRNRSGLDPESAPPASSHRADDTARRNRKAQRTQSRNARRKRH